MVQASALVPGGELYNSLRSKVNWTLGSQAVAWVAILAAQLFSPSPVFRLAVVCAAICTWPVAVVSWRKQLRSIRKLHRDATPIVVERRPVPEYEVVAAHTRRLVPGFPSPPVATETTVRGKAIKALVLDIYFATPIALIATVLIVSLYIKHVLF